MRVAYADPSYSGCAHLYKNHPDYGGEVDHEELINQLQSQFDGWILHTHVPGLRMMERKGWIPDEVRLCSWVKSFAAFKRNVPVAYAWEPVIIKACRKPVVSGRQVMRDFIETPAIKCPITLQRGLAGAKPEKVCWWAFELAGLTPDDELIDLYPGTGAVSVACDNWRYDLVNNAEVSA